VLLTEDITSSTSSDVIVAMTKIIFTVRAVGIIAVVAVMEAAMVEVMEAAMVEVMDTHGFSGVKSYMYTIIPALVSVVLSLTAIVIYGSWIAISSNHDS
jgi:uncharacterized membrane protein YdjX (TVP38/TMEM64 family)